MQNTDRRWRLSSRSEIYLWQTSIIYLVAIRGDRRGQLCSSISFQCTDKQTGEIFVEKNRHEVKFRRRSASPPESNSEHSPPSRVYYEFEKPVSLCLSFTTVWTVWTLDKASHTGSPRSLSIAQSFKCVPIRCKANPTSSDPTKRGKPSSFQSRSAENFEIFSVLICMYTRFSRYHGA